MELGREWVGAAGLLEGAGPPGEVLGKMRMGATEVDLEADLFPDVDPIWHYGFVFAPVLTVGGGTWAAQRNIVAEHVLGLPRDVNVEKGKTCSELRSGG
jgi:hypothetical protein